VITVLLKRGIYPIVCIAGWLYVCAVKIIDTTDSKKIQNPRKTKSKHPKKPKPRSRKNQNPVIQRKPKLRICYQLRLTS
jgi:hypothetical protein